MLYINPLEMTAPAAPGTEAFEAYKRKTAFKELEQQFTSMLLKEMRKTVPESKLFGAKSPMRKLHNDLMDDLIAGKWAESGQLGIARQLEEQMRIAEAQDEIRGQLMDARA